MHVTQVSGGGRTLLVSKCVKYDYRQERSLVGLRYTVPQRQLNELAEAKTLMSQSKTNKYTVTSGRQPFKASDWKLKNDRYTDID